MLVAVVLLVDQTAPTTCDGEVFFDEGLPKAQHGPNDPEEAVDVSEVTEGKMAKRRTWLPDDREVGIQR